MLIKNIFHLQKKKKKKKKKNEYFFGLLVSISFFSLSFCNLYDINVVAN